MKIKEVKLSEFKRFTDLTVNGLPESAKLVIMAGPNGSGKSSFFDALYAWRGGSGFDATYHVKSGSTKPNNLNEFVRVEFYRPIPNRTDKRKFIYVRSAYRNDPEFQLRSLSQRQSALDEIRFNRLIDNDAAVSSNYQRILSQGLEDVFENEDAAVTMGEFREKTIGDIRRAISRLFPDLILNSLGNPLSEGTFRFDKGSSKKFLYKNLSGGEKAAFDLLLDLIVKRREYDDTVFCIDEPETHMNARLHGALLAELFDLVPDGSQLWLATHSIGMMRRARDFAQSRPGEIVFLDFGDRDFDQSQTITPTSPNRRFWERVLEVALDDLSALVAPTKVVICEGAPNIPGSGKNAAMDAQCYDKIFGDQFPDTKFISAGNANSVETDRIALLESLRSIVRGVEVVRLIDRDDLSAEDVADRQRQGVRVLSKRNLESYLFDDEILRALCVEVNRPEESDNLINDKAAAVAASVCRGSAPDDIKSAAGQIYNAAKGRLGLTACGNDSKSFMRTTLAPLVRPGSTAYEQLRQDIFGA